MADLKMRVPDSKSYIAMMQAMGSTTVTVDLSELYLALSQHVAGGMRYTPTANRSATSARRPTTCLSACNTAG